MIRPGRLHLRAAVGSAVLALVLLGAAPAWARDATSAPPDFYKMTLSGATVTVYWIDKSNNEGGFEVQVYTAGRWQPHGDVVTLDSTGVGTPYQLTDPAALTPSEGERCYRIVISYDISYPGERIPGISETRCVSAPPAPSASTAANPPRTNGTGPTHTAQAVAPPAAQPEPLSSSPASPATGQPAPVGAPASTATSYVAWYVTGGGALLGVFMLLASAVAWSWHRRRSTAAGAFAPGSPAVPVWLRHSAEIAPHAAGLGPPSDPWAQADPHAIPPAANPPDPTP